MNYRNWTFYPYWSKTLDFARKASWRSFDQQVIGTFAANVLIIVFGVIGGIVMARALGPEGRGQIAAVLIVASTVNWVFGCGLSWGNLYYLNKLPGETSAILTNAIFFAAVMGIPVIITGVIVLVTLFGDFPTEIRIAAFVYFLTVPVAMAADYLIFAQQALQEFLLFNVARVGRQGIQVLFLTSLAIGHSLTVARAILIVSLANLLLAVVVSVWFRRSYWCGFRIDIHLLKKCLNFGIKAYFGSLAQTGSRRIDQIIMITMVTPTQLGLYSVATSLSEGVSIIPSAISMVNTPRVAQLNEVSGRKLLKSNLLVAGLTVALLVFFGIVLAIPFLRIFYGKPFESAALSLQVLLVASWFLGLGDLISQGLTGLGRPIQGTYSEISALALSMILLVALVPAFGITGAAIASLLAYSVRFTLVALFAFVRN